MKIKPLHTDIEQLKRDKIAAKKKKVQQNIKNKYAYLQSVDKPLFQYEFLKAQAKKICQLDLELRLSPFRSLYSNFLAMVSDSAFLTNHCVKFNEFGILEVDEVALAKFKPIEIKFPNKK